MNATCGLTGKISSPSESLQSLLASKLQARSNGSILYRLTWKNRITPSGRAICALRASAARMSGKEIILSGFPTPCLQDGPNGGPGQGTDRLPAATAACGWPTPRTSDTNGAGLHGDGGLDCRTAASLSAWPTPRAADSGRTVWNPSKGGGNVQLDRMTALYLLENPQPARLCSDGHLLTGSSAEMESGGRLNPAHSRWLMRLPREWDDCAPTATRSTRKPPRNSVQSSKKFATVFDL